MKALVSDVELAEILGITVEDVRLNCRHRWPRVKSKRSVWRFTDAMVEQIIEMQSVQPARQPRAAQSARSPRSRARAS